MNIRLAQIADAAQLASLAQSVFTATYGPALPAAVLKNYLRQHFSPEALTRELANPNARHLLALAHNAPIGFSRLEATPPPACISGPQPLEMVKLYVAPAYHGCGVAAQLMEHSLREAWALGHRTLWLYVWTQNPRAIAFYRKWGFAPVGTDDIWVEHIAFRDWVMEKRLT
jgi:ribosomal protein S18 acetylase RimI-like enzyme